MASRIGEIGSLIIIYGPKLSGISNLTSSICVQLCRNFIQLRSPCSEDAWGIFWNAPLSLYLQKDIRNVDKGLN